MAEREAGKAKKRAVRAAVPGPAGAGTGIVGEGPHVRVLERERDALRAELEVAQARIAELEKAREQVLNRIDWVIDSLHNLIED